MKKLNTENFIWIQRALLRLLGVWPNKSATFFDIFLCIWNFFVIYLNAVLMLHGVFFASNFSQFVQNLNFFVMLSVVVVKLTIFYFNRSTFLKLLDFLQEPIFYSYYDDLEDHLVHVVNTFTFLSKTYQVMACPIVFFICIAPLFGENRQQQLPLDYGLKNAIENSTFFYVFVYIVQAWSFLSAACGTMGTDGVATSLMGVTGAYFEILQETIKRVTNSLSEIKDQNSEVYSYGEFDTEIEKKLKKCVDFHTAIIRLVETTEEIFTYIFLLQFIFSGVSICVVGFTFVITSPGSYEFVTAVGAFVLLVFEISLHCVYGEEVTNQSLKVREACYMTEWVGCEPKVRKILFIIMERSKRPSVLTAGKFIKLSHYSLAAILRSAYSYGTVLLQLYKE